MVYGFEIGIHWCKRCKSDNCATCPETLCSWYRCEFSCRRNDIETSYFLPWLPRLSVFHCNCRPRYKSRHISEASNKQHGIWSEKSEENPELIGEMERIWNTEQGGCFNFIYQTSFLCSTDSTNSVCRLSVTPLGPYALQTHARWCNFGKLLSNKDLNPSHH